MWNGKIRKLTDILVLGVVGATILTFGGIKMFGSLGSYNAYSAEYDAMYQAWLDSQKDENGRIPIKVAGVDPTETTVGYTPGKKDKITGEFFEGHEEIPMINSDNYDRVVKNNGDAGLVVIWSIKQSYLDEHLSNHVIADFTYTMLESTGFVVMNGTKYLSLEFNTAFPGIEMSYDKASSTIIWDVKEDDYKLENAVISVPTTNDHLKITGKSLIIETTGKNNAIDLKTTTNNLIIDNNTSIVVNNDKDSDKNKYGISAHNIDINQNKSLTVRNYCYGIYSEGEITVNGTLNTAGTAYVSTPSVSDSAIYCGNNLGGSYINVGSGKAVYSEEQIVNATDGKVRFDDCGKHLIICDSNASLDNLLQYKVVDLPTVPTETTTGKARFGCDCCGSVTDMVIDLPVLSATNYNISATTEYINDGVYDTTKYELKDKSHGDISFFTDKVKVNNYFKAGSNYASETLWNTRYPNAQASSTGSTSSRVLTITLNGTQELNMDDYLEPYTEVANALDLTSYSQVIIAGSGTLNINFSKKSPGMIVRKLQINEGATVNLNGVDRGTTSNQSGYYGIKINSNLTVAGELNITKFAAGFFVATGYSGGIDIDIKDTGKVTMSYMSNCIYNYSEVRLNNKGTLDLASDPASTACNGIKSESNFILTCSGDSKTTISNGYPIQAYNALKNDVSIYIQDNSEFTVAAAKQYGILNYTKLIVGNGTDGSTKCNAKVSVTTSVNAALYARPATGKESLTVFNSTNPVTLKKTGSAATALIYIDGNVNHSFKALTDVNCEGCKSIFGFKNTPKFNAEDFVVGDETNPVFKITNSSSVTYLGDYADMSNIPTNLPSSIAKRS